MEVIRYMEVSDKKFWYSLDRHLPETEFENKVYNKQGYVLLENNKPIGLLRYNLFWDNVPFCTMLFDCGGLVVDIQGYEQPIELFLIKAL